MDIPKIFVISPKEMATRRESTERHLTSLGLNPTFFSGLYGNDVKIQSGHNDPNRPFAHYRNMSSGMLCCSLNHVVLAGLPSAIIFEDDVCLPDDFLDFFNGMMTRTPNDWEMIYMSLLYPIRMFQGKIGADQVGEGVYRFRGMLAWDGACDGLYADVISQSAAKKFTDLRLTLDESMDRWISAHGLPLVNTYIWHPSEITQHSERTGKQGFAPPGFETTVH